MTAADHLLDLITALRDQLDRWQDEERQAAEKRLRVDAADLDVLEDPRYDTVLETISTARARLADLDNLAGPGWCPGCVGRGTGARCCMCGRPIPLELWRRPGSADEYDRECPDCLAGRNHTHGGVS